MRRVALFVKVMAVVLVLAACQQQGSGSVPNPRAPGALVMPAGYGAVVGGIEPTYRFAATTPTQVAYVHGTVVVLRGRVSQWVYVPDPRALGLPRVAFQTVPDGGTYKFILAPGPYILVEDNGQPYKRTVDGGTIVSPVAWVSVFVFAGQTRSMDIPPSL